MSRLTMPGFDELTPEQDRILRLPDDGRYLVQGPPGTGKTIVALLRATAMSWRKNPPHLLVHNRLLRDYCDQMLRRQNLATKVSTWHSWFCRHFRQTYGHSPPALLDQDDKPRPFLYDWRKITDTCAAAGEISPNPTPLLIDEGQDMPRQFYGYIHLHFPHIMVFADENQRLDEHANSTIQTICEQLGISEEDRHPLQDNMRNTRQIAQVARHFYAGVATGLPDLPNRLGPIPYLIDYEDLDHFAERIVRHALIHPESLVGIFTAANQNLEALRGLLAPLCHARQVAFACYTAAAKTRIDFDVPGIVLLNLQSMKGLEFDTVLVADLHSHIVQPNAAAHRMRLYVAASRPRHRLFLFHERERPAPILEVMPKEDVLYRYSLRRNGASS